MKLREKLQRDSKVMVTIAGENGEPSLGKGLARQQWLVAHPEQGAGAWRMVVSCLDAHVAALRRDFPNRVKLGTVGFKEASPTHFQVWGANAKNWALPNGTKIGGKGQAKCMEKQAPGVFGIVTTPCRGPPEGRVSTAAALAAPAAGEYPGVCKITNIFSPLLQHLGACV